MSEAVQERKERRISSPEKLHDYMHVTGPGLWIMLALIIVLMAVLIYFASTVKLENLMEVSADVTDDGAGGEPAALLCSLTGSRKDQVKVGMKVRVAGHEGTITTLVEDDDEVIVRADLDRSDVELKDGAYDATIVLESTSPVSFLMEH